MNSNTNSLALSVVCSFYLSYLMSLCLIWTRDALLQDSPTSRDNMLHELLLVMATPTISKSDIFRPVSISDDVQNPSTYKVSPTFDYLHPAERSQFDRLGQLAFRYATISEFCSTYLRTSHRQRLSTKSEGIQSAAMDVLCASIQDILHGYEGVIIDTERKVITKDDHLVGSRSMVPISRLVAIFSPWEAPLSELDTLVKVLQGKIENSTLFSAKWLMEYLRTRMTTGVDTVAECMKRLYRAVEMLFLRRVTSWVVYGVLPNTESDGFFISEVKSSNKRAEFSLDDEMIPSSISRHVASSTLYIGRAHATVKQAIEKTVPEEMTSEHIKLMTTLSSRRRTSPCHHVEIEKVVSRIRQDVASWLWTTILTRDRLRNCLGTFRDYFLMGKADYGISLLREVDKLRENKSMSRTPLAYKEPELNAIIIKAGIGTMAQDDLTLDDFRFTLGKDTDRIHMILIGIPLRFTYALSWPMDLFLSPEDVLAYSDLFAHLAIIKRAQLRVNDSWAALSSMKRIRLRDAQRSGQSSDATDLERHLWSTTQMLSFFLECVWTYFEADVIETAFERLLEKTRLSSGENLDFDQITTAHQEYLQVLKRDLLVVDGWDGLYVVAVTMVDKWCGMLTRFGATRSIQDSKSTKSEQLDEVRAFKDELQIMMEELVARWMEVVDPSGWEMRERLLLKLDYAGWFTRSTIAEDDDGDQGPAAASEPIENLLDELEIREN